MGLLKKGEQRLTTTTTTAKQQQQQQQQRSERDSHTVLVNRNITNYNYKNIIIRTVAWACSWRAKAALINSPNWCLVLLTMQTVSLSPSCWLIFYRCCPASSDRACPDTKVRSVDTRVVELHLPRTVVAELVLTGFHRPVNRTGSAQDEQTAPPADKGQNSPQMHEPYPTFKKCEVKTLFASALLSLHKGRDLWTLSCDFVPHNGWNIKMAIIDAHLNAWVIHVVTV